MRNGVRLALVSCVVLGALIFAEIGSAATPRVIVNTIGAATPGESGALFNNPRGVAVNQTGAGDVAPGTFYVVDTNNRRVQRFSPEGTFVSAWGWKVDRNLINNEFQICTDAASCQKGTGGGGAGQFGATNDGQGIGIDQATGTVYVSAAAGATRRINIFSAQGNFEGAFGWGVETGANALQFCTASTGCTTASLNPGEGVPPGPCGFFGSPLGDVAVDAAGDIYVAHRAFRRVDVFRPTFTGSSVTGVECRRVFGWNVVEEGPDDTVADEFEICDVATNPTDVCREGAAGSGLGQFANSSPVDVDLDSEGNVFAIDNNSTPRIQVFSSASAPLSSSFGSVALANVFGTGELVNLSIDRTNDHVFVAGKRSSSGNELAVLELDHSGNEVVTHGTELPVNSAATATGLGGLAVASSTLGGNIYVPIGTTGVLQGVHVLNAKPELTGITDITGTTAVFHGKVVSNGIDVLYHFEYSTDGQTWKSAPPKEVDAGVAPEDIVVEEDVSGLTGSQTYFVRLVQNRPAGGGIATSAVDEFTTEPAAPEIRGGVAWPIKDTSATLNALLNPENESTAFHFELGLGDCGAPGAECIDLPASGVEGEGFRLVTQSPKGLAPGTVYHYRLVAVNETGVRVGPDHVFETYASGKKLIDRRAYEIVSPGDPGSVKVDGAFLGFNDGFSCFAQSPASANGNSVIALSRGGALPGIAANGNADLYRFLRSANGWTTSSRGLSGAESVKPENGGGLCSSPDHGFSSAVTSPAPDEGSLVLEGKATTYVRGPDGSLALVGAGEISDPEANVRWISENGTHLIFSSKEPLLATSPPSGTEAIYDRSPSGQLELLSVLPGNLTPLAGEDASYQGVSRDGSVVAFKVAGVMYVRTAADLTVEIGPEPITFAGLSNGGDAIFYAAVTPIAPASGGQPPTPSALFKFDIATESATELAEDSSFVNVSADGSHAYLISELNLTGTETNSRGDQAEAGQPNLYVWDQGTEDLHFVGVVDPEDIVQRASGRGNVTLVAWTTGAVDPHPNAQTGPGNDPSRTTPDGSVIVFESKANLTGENEFGVVEIYRYAADSGALQCISCSPTGQSPLGDSRLQIGTPETTSFLVETRNVTDNGATVFFQTQNPLVPADVNGTWDVYEWKLGQQPYLISSGQSTLESFLYSVTPSGDDVFFTTAERLIPADLSSVPSIYDARVDGGFIEASAPPPPCKEDACQGAQSAPPALPAAASPALQGGGNVAKKKKQQHKKKKHKKQKQKKKHRSHQASAKRGNGR